MLALDEQTPTMEAHGIRFQPELWEQIVRLAERLTKENKKEVRPAAAVRALCRAGLELDRQEKRARP